MARSRPVAGLAGRPAAGLIPKVVNKDAFLWSMGGAGDLAPLPAAPDPMRGVGRVPDESGIASGQVLSVDSGATIV